MLMHCALRLDICRVGKMSPSSMVMDSRYACLWFLLESALIISQARLGWCSEHLVTRRRVSSILLTVHFLFEFQTRLQNLFDSFGCEICESFVLKTHLAFGSPAYRLHGGHRMKVRRRSLFLNYVDAELPSSGPGLFQNLGQHLRIE